MPKNAALLIAIAIFLGVTAYSLVLRPHLPPTVPIHWNIRGQVDGYGPRDLSLFLMPAIMLFLLGLWFVLPWLSPKAFKVEGFRPAWDWIWLDAMGLMAFCHVVILHGGIHPGFNFGKILLSGMCAFFALMGPPLAKVKRNFWMGYRTPWTLANDKVWESTHRFASKTLTVSGLVVAVAVWAGVPLAVCIGGFVAGALVPVVQSAIEYKTLEARGEL